jgi:hypothetical protein
MTHSTTFSASEFLQQYPLAFLSSESEDSAVFPGFRHKVGDGTAKPRALPGKFIDIPYNPPLRNSHKL